MLVPAYENQTKWALKEPIGRFEDRVSTVFGPFGGMLNRNFPQFESVTSAVSRIESELDMVCMASRKTIAPTHTPASGVTKEGGGDFKLVMIQSSHRFGLAASSPNLSESSLAGWAVLRLRCTQPRTVREPTRQTGFRQIWRRSGETKPVA